MDEDIIRLVREKRFLPDKSSIISCILVLPNIHSFLIYGCLVVQKTGSCIIFQPHKLIRYKLNEMRQKEDDICERRVTGLPMEVPQSHLVANLGSCLFYHFQLLFDGAQGWSFFLLVSCVYSRARERDWKERKKRTMRWNHQSPHRK